MAIKIRIKLETIGKRLNKWGQMKLVLLFADNQPSLPPLITIHSPNWIAAASNSSQGNESA
jgi:hypothetical protein